MCHTSLSSAPRQMSETLACAHAAARLQSGKGLLLPEPAAASSHRSAAPVKVAWAINHSCMQAQQQGVGRHLQAIKALGRAAPARQPCCTSASPASVRQKYLQDSKASAQSSAGTSAFLALLVGPSCSRIHRLPPFAAAAGASSSLHRPTRLQGHPLIRDTSVVVHSDVARFGCTAAAPHLTSQPGPPRKCTVPALTSEPIELNDVLLVLLRTCTCVSWWHEASDRRLALLPFAAAGLLLDAGSRGMRDICFRARSWVPLCLRVDAMRRYA